MKYLFSHTTKNNLSVRARAGLPGGTKSGFTLVETLVAIFILMLTIGALLTLTAGGYFSIRYAKNDIVAANLLQESLEYIRNTRDTASQTTGGSWDTWFAQYAACDATSSDKIRCMINPYAENTADAVVACRSSTNPKGACDPLIYFNDVDMYGYNKADFDSTDKKPTTTSFVRYIQIQKVTTTADPQLIVTATIDWMNGTSPKEVQQSIILTKWNLQ